MNPIIPERMMAQVETDKFVVFLIGARVNRPWKLFSALRVGRAMTKMMAELRAKPELGLLSAEEYFGRTTLMVQYWKSLEHLLAYAHAKDSNHLPAWRDFNRLIARSGDVGIWHETYVIGPGAYENIYVNMPRFGLGRAGTLAKVRAHGRKSVESARERLESRLPDAPDRPNSRSV